jgi:hypothetical protein
LGQKAYASKAIGVSSKLFGNARYGTNGPGRWNNYGKLKIGWSHFGNKNLGYANFRIGFKAAGKKRHINLMWGPKLWK